MAITRVDYGKGFTDLPPYKSGDEPRLFLGIDIGSKTIKVVVQDAAGELRYCSYNRHLSDVRKTLGYVLDQAKELCPDEPMKVGITGSAGMALAEGLAVPFTQEVVACRTALKHLIPQADVAIEIGGEDSKILFLTGGEELRMNSTCAGGTGGFIDTLAGMLDCNAEELNFYAHGCKTVYPIASRCAVFAQMDVRPLLNEGISREDIAGSVFDAVAAQCISGLACGRPIHGTVALLGGPMHFLSSLRDRFQKRLGLADEDIYVPENGHLFVAQGAAFQAESAAAPVFTLGELIERIAEADLGGDDTLMRLEPLFANREEYQEFQERHNRCKVPRLDISSYEGRAYLGVDSGSEAIKYALIAEDGSVLHTAYERSAGNLIDVARDILIRLYKRMPRKHDGTPAIQIAHATVTGYGEAYLKQAFSFDSGEVETVSHVRATQELIPDADFILDIGGQDIKCVWLRDGKVENVVLNEACSSGCGALISGMAWSINVHLNEFIDAALLAEEPVDLGTRCTVFMTSRVRHAQKAGASTGDISAGLAYSVVRNAVHKVIRAHSADELGKNIVVQGGTFANDAVLRAFEKTYGREVRRADIAPYMGAYGAALIARERGGNQEATSLLNRNQLQDLHYRQTVVPCQLCTNACHLVVTKFTVDGQQRKFVVGNRCERGGDGAGADANADASAAGSSELPDMFDFRYKLLFDRPVLSAGEAPRGPMGLVRALDMYETYPFWHAFLSQLGFEVVLSDGKLDGPALETIPSESLCYPAKLAHGQMMDLLGREVPYILLPYVDGMGEPGTACPVVAEYPLVLQTVVAPHGPKTKVINPVLPSLFVNEGDKGAAAEGLDGSETAAAEGLGLGFGRRKMWCDIPHFSSPAESASTSCGSLTVSERFLQNCEVLQEALLSVDPSITIEEVWEAYGAGLQAQERYLSELKEANLQALDQVIKADGRAVVLAGRPYHGDPAVHHGIPDLLKSCGYAVLSEEIALGDSPVTHWDFPHRVVDAACFVAKQPQLDFVELTSFGCGLDAAASDMVRDLLQEAGKMPTCLKIDEMSDLASARIRVRSMLAAREGLLSKNGGSS